jgi:prefoldin subunit 5
MPYDINSALERLEQNLKDLDSAKKQVEATVNASDKLQQVVSGYVNTLVSVQEGLKQWEKELQGIQVGNDTAFKNAIEQMRATCSEVVDLFKSKLDETKDGFEADTNSFLVKLERENGKLSEQVNALKILGSSFDNAIKDVNNVKALLETLSIDLKESQRSQDEVLDVIKEDVGRISNTTSNTIKGYVDEQTRKIETLHSGKDTKLQELANAISSVKQVCDDIKEKSNSIENCCQDIRSNSDSLLR